MLLFFQYTTAINDSGLEQGLYSSTELVATCRLLRTAAVDRHHDQDIDNKSPSDKYPASAAQSLRTQMHHGTERTHI